MECTRRERSCCVIGTLVVICTVVLISTVAGFVGSTGRTLTVAQAKTIFQKSDAVCFDVDSTVCQDEAIDELADYLGVGIEVAKVTEEAMNGGMTFREALTRRLGVMKPSVSDVERFIHKRPCKLTTGIVELVRILQQRGTKVYLISGGFESIIQPVAKVLNIPLENIYANKLLFDLRGIYAGFDKDSLVSDSGGKPLVIEELKRKYHYENLVMVGDGSTDLETFPTSDAFVGFGGNRVRDTVKRGSPWFVMSFPEMIDVLAMGEKSW